VSSKDCIFQNTRQGEEETGRKRPEKKAIGKRTNGTNLPGRLFAGGSELFLQDWEGGSRASQERCRLPRGEEPSSGRGGKRSPKTKRSALPLRAGVVGDQLKGEKVAGISKGRKSKACQGGENHFYETQEWVLLGVPQRKRTHDTERRTLRISSGACKKPIFTPPRGMLLDEPETKQREKQSGRPR